MLDVSKSVTLSKDLQERKNESLNALMKNREIHDFVIANHCPKQVISDAWAELLNFEEDSKKCLHCRGIQDCPKVTKGVRTMLDYDGDSISLVMKYCQYGKEKEKEQLILSHFIYNNISRNLALSDFHSNQFIKNGDHLSPVNKLTIAKMLDYLNAPYGKGFYLSGDSGSGKTVLMAALMNQLAKRGFDVGIVHFPSFLIDIKNSFSSNDQSFMKVILDVPYLMIDGLGEENITNWSRDEILLTILNYRDINRLPTFITSMFRLGELDDVYSLRRDASEMLRAGKIRAKISTMCEEMSIERLK
jgi:DNA replication protein DnaC